MTTGRFDVVVVGVRARGSQAVAELATAVSRVTGLAPGAVLAGLEGGEVVVHQGLSKTQAVVAARTVQGLGAIVDVRPARGDEDAVEPDDDLPPPRRPTAETPFVPPAVVLPTVVPAAVVPPAVPAQASGGPAAMLDPGAPVLDLGGPPVAPRFAVGPPDPPKLELDFAAAGLSAPPPGRNALRPATATGPQPVAVAPAEGLIVADRLASALFGAAIAVTLGMLVAFAVVRGDAKAIAGRLEPELAEAVADPVRVAAGRLRAPATIVAEIDDGLADVRTKYLLVWAAIAVPLAAVAGLLKRPSRSA